MMVIGIGLTFPLSRNQTGPGCVQTRHFGTVLQTATLTAGANLIAVHLPVPGRHLNASIHGNQELRSFA